MCLNCWPCASAGTFFLIFRYCVSWSFLGGHNFSQGAKNGIFRGFFYKKELTQLHGEKFRKNSTIVFAHFNELSNEYITIFVPLPYDELFFGVMPIYG